MSNFWFLKPGVFMIPFIGKRRLPMNKDGSVFDTGELDLLDEQAPFYVDVWAFEWFGFGFPIWPFAVLMDSRTGKPVDGLR